MQPDTTDADAERNASLIKRATMAVLDELQRQGVADNATVCLAVAGSLVGVLAASCGNPAEALASVNAVARAVMDGSLLDA